MRDNILSLLCELNTSAYGNSNKFSELVSLINKSPGSFKTLLYDFAHLKSSGSYVVNPPRLLHELYHKIELVNTHGFAPATTNSLSDIVFHANKSMYKEKSLLIKEGCFHYQLKHSLHRDYMMHKFIDNKKIFTSSGFNYMHCCLDYPDKWTFDKELESWIFNRLYLKEEEILKCINVLNDIPLGPESKDVIFKK